MAIVTKIMMGLAIIAGIVGIVMGMSIPDGVDKIIKDRDKFEEDGKKYKKEKTDVRDELNTKTNEAVKLKGDLDTKDGELKKAKTELKTAKKEKVGAVNAKDSAEGKLKDADDAKMLAEGNLQGALDGKADAERQLLAAREQLNNAGGASVQLRKYEALMINGVPVDFAKMQELVAAEAKRAAAPPKPGKVSKVNANFGLYYINYGEKYTSVGTRYTVRRNNNLVGYLTVIRIQGTESVCKLDKANSPGLPLVGDDIKK